MPVTCYLCEEDLERKYYLECTKCVLFNGDPFVYVSVEASVGLIDAHTLKPYP